MKAGAWSSPLSGFTLMEMVVTLVILSVVSTAIISLNGMVGMRSNQMQNMQKSTQLMQACMETVIGLRRSSGRTAVETALTALGTACSNIDPTSGITLSVQSLPSASYCPTGMSCLEIKISASAGSTTYTLPGLVFVGN